MRLLRLITSSLLLSFGLAAFAQVPIDPRTNPNVTPLDVYALHPLDLNDAINHIGVTPPNFSRANAGDAEYNIHKCRGVYALTGSGNLFDATGQANPNTSWVPENETIGARTIFSDSAIPHWAGAASTSAFGLTGCSDTRDNPSLRPYDSYYSDTGVVQTAMAGITCGNVAVNGAPGDTPSGVHGDCIKQEFYTAVMQKACGVTKRPTTPLLNTCRIHDFEGVNESDTGQQWGQTSGTWTRLAAQEADEARIVFAYCGDCTYYIGSMACGGKQYSLGGTNGLCDQNMSSLLDQFHIVAPDIPSTRLGISYHDYSDQEVVFPGVGATNAISGDGSGSNTDATGAYIHRTGFGSSLCTLANVNASNKHCEYSIIEIRQRMRSVIQSKSWMNPAAPMLETEGGYYFDDQMFDETHTDSLTGATFTATNQRGYMGQLVLITADAQNPLYGTGCGTIGCGPIGSNWYQMDSSGTGGLTLYRSVATNAYCSPYVKGGDCSIIETHSVACFGIEYRGPSYTDAADCYRSSHQFTNAVGVHPIGQAHATALSWINKINRFTTHFDDVTGAHAKFNSVWSATALNNDGTTVQFMFDTGWERHTTVSTCYPTKTTLQGVTSAIVGGTFVLGTEPVMLSGTCAGVASDFTLAATPATLTMTAGTTATISVASTAVGTFAGSEAVTIAGLPATVTAAPSTFTLTANGTQSVVLTAAAAATNPQPVPSSPATGTVTMTSSVVGNIPAGFLSLSYTKSKLMNNAARFFSAGNSRGIADFKGLGVGTLRLVTGDNEVWTPAGAGQTTGQISQSDVDNLAAFLTATGWKCTYGIPFLSNTTSAAVAEATYVASKLGSSLVGFEIGNEPDGTGYTSTGITASSFATAWRVYALDILAAVPSAQFVGPSTGVATNAGTYSTAMETTNADLVLWDTSHFYHDGPTTATIAEMLSFTASDGFYNSMVSGIHTTQTTYPDAWVINETNDIYSGGADGVSNTFSSALYALDFSFVAAKSGATMVNWISGGMGTAPSNPYSVIQDSNGYTYQEQPKYAGLLLFALATQGNNGASMLSTSITSSGNNVKAYGLQYGDGSQAVVILNESTTNMNMAVTFPQTIASANILTLSDASGLADKVNTNVLLQGQPLGYTPPVPGAPYTATITSGHAGVYVPANSAVLVNGQGSSISGRVIWTAVSGALTHSDDLALTVNAAGGTTRAQQTTYAAHGRKKR